MCCVYVRAHLHVLCVCVCVHARAHWSRCWVTSVCDMRGGSYLRLFSVQFPKRRLSSPTAIDELKVGAKDFLAFPVRHLDLFLPIIIINKNFMFAL